MISGPGSWRILGLVLAAGAAACARQGAPTGGPDDRRPPVVAWVRPDTFAVVPAGLDEIQVRFNERISERTAGGDLASAVIISPEVPEVEVEHDRFGLNIRIPGGLAPGRVYTIRVLPEIQDMFGNPMAVPFEWALSTGGAFTQNAVVGQVWDRATGDFLEGVRVVLTSREAADEDAQGSYAVLSGTEGLYALRVLPPGPFRLQAFQDVNRNRILDATEPAGSLTDSLGPADTLFVSVPILAPDTTPAVLAQAVVLDSTVVRLVFDDYLDPTVPVDTVLVWLDPDTLAAPGADSAVAPPPPLIANELPAPLRLFHEYGWSAHLDSLRATRDSLLAAAVERARAAGDTARADSLARAGIEPLPGGGSGTGTPGSGGGDPLPDGTPAPQPSLVVVFDRPLPAGVPLRIHVFGAVNLTGRTAGGGDVGLVREPEPPDSIPADSVGVGDPAAAADTGLVILKQGR